MRYSVLTIVAVCITPLLFAGDSRCKGNPKVVAQCYVVHGRATFGAGTPALRIWPVGTKRMLGITAGPRADDADDPIVPKEMLVFKNGHEELYGDFEVCPFTPERPGVMRMVCVESAAHLNLKNPSEPPVSSTTPPIPPAGNTRPVRVAAGMPCGSAAPEQSRPSQTGSQKNNRRLAGNSLCGGTHRFPNYPPLAKRARIQGPVRLKAVIGKDGIIKSLELVEGHPMLVSAAMDAVRQWKYKPHYQDGKPVEVETEIVVNYTLSGGDFISTDETARQNQAQQ